MKSCVDYFRHQLRVSLARQLTRKPSKRKIRLDCCVTANIPPSMFERLLPFVVATNDEPGKMTFKFCSLEAVEKAFEISSRTHKRVDDVCTVTYVSVTAMVKEPFHAQHVPEAISVDPHDRLLLKSVESCTMNLATK